MAVAAWILAASLTGVAAATEQGPPELFCPAYQRVCTYVVAVDADVAETADVAAEGAFSPLAGNASQATDATDGGTAASADHGDHTTAATSATSATSADASAAADDAALALDLADCAGGPWLDDALCGGLVTPGPVGIGTDPVAALDVVGSVHLGGLDVDHSGGWSVAGGLTADGLSVRGSRESRLDPRNCRSEGPMLYGSNSIRLISAGDAMHCPVPVPAGAWVESVTCGDSTQQFLAWIQIRPWDDPDAMEYFGVDPGVPLALQRTLGDHEVIELLAWRDGAPTFFEGCTVTWSR